MAGRNLCVKEIETLLNVDTESECDFSSDGSDDNFEPEANRESSDESSNEFSADENEILPGSSFTNADPMFISKDNIVWSPYVTAQAVGRTQAANILRLKPGCTRATTSRVSSMIDAFLLYFPPNIEKVILENTNKFGRFINENHKEVDANLLYAYIAVLLLAGVYKAKNQAVSELFEVNFGPPIFRAIMSKETFEYLTRVIRFDDTENRRRNRSEDKFAPIRELWDHWVQLLPVFYNPSECVTIDEQLCGFNGRCSFRQYMPSKPEKYGLKFWQLVDSKSYYVWNIQPYLGKSAGCAPEKNVGQRVVMDLVEGLRGHNVTMDNFFVSHELGQNLLKKQITMVGTIRKNKRSIPPKLLLCKKAPLYQSTFAFAENTVLVSYVSRKDKCTVLQSTLHDSAEVGTDAKKMPEIVSYYNKTKGGVDTVDKIISTYSSKRKTNRWPMAVFSNMIDISALNAFVIFQEINPGWPQTNKKSKRRLFLRNLGIELAKPYMAERGKKGRSPFVLSGISEQQPTESKSIPEQIKKRGKCFLCIKENNAKQKYNHEFACCLCKKSICKAHHTRAVCVECI